MPRPGGLAVFVTSHGFGHLNRSVAVINRVPLEIPVAIRCTGDLFSHWRERLTRPAALIEHRSDIGALNPAGDSAATDGPGTLEAAGRVHAEALGRLDADVDWLRTAGVAAVLSDAPPLPLVAARRAEIPAYLLANFTWADIYAPHAQEIGGEAVRFVEEIRAAYRQATAIFRAEPALPMANLAPTIEVGLVANPGRDRRLELCDLLGIASTEKLVYFYVGRYGQADLAWSRLGNMAGVHFVGFHPAPSNAPTNLHVVPPTEWTGADLAASADAAVAKAGYGTACEAMVAQTPLIYPPRVGFAEHDALDRALRAWGGGLPASAEEFAELRLESLLTRAFELKPGPPPFPIDGAERVAAYLTEVCRSGEIVR